MTGHDVFVVLDKMLRAGRLAVSFIEGLTEEDFLGDLRTQQAVAMNLLIVGEAAGTLGRKHLDFAAKYPELPWRDMVGMRNRIAHNYFDLDPGVIWRTTREDLPELVQRLEDIYRKAGEPLP
jgi:uncharacterized protein with HEPN domain